MRILFSLVITNSAIKTRGFFSYFQCKTFSHFTLKLIFARFATRKLFSSNVQRWLNRRETKFLVLLSCCEFIYYKTRVEFRENVQSVLIVVSRLNTCSLVLFWRHLSFNDDLIGFWRRELNFFYLLSEFTCYVNFLHSPYIFTFNLFHCFYDKKPFCFGCQ